MKETPRRRITVTSSLNEIVHAAEDRGGWKVLRPALPIPTYSRVLDINLKVPSGQIRSA
jgi:hypothetical protein